MIRPKPIKKVNNIYQIDEGIFDILKAIITGKSSDITKIPDKELSKQGRALKKATIALEKEFRQKAKAKGVDPKQYAKDIIKQRDLRLAAAK